MVEADHKHEAGAEASIVIQILGKDAGLWCGVRISHSNVRRHLVATVGDTKLYPKAADPYEIFKISYRENEISTLKHVYSFFT